MIIKKQAREADRKARPVIGVLLFLISLILLVITGPIGFIYGIFHSVFRRGFRGLGEYLLKIAISIDQLGNVMMQYLLNLLWVKEAGYYFGNRDETISSALGRNRQLGTLTPFGLIVDALLDRIDPNHSLNSIDYYIEPNPAISDRLSWIHIANNKLLFLKKTGRNDYFLPGGPKVPGTADSVQLSTYLKNTLRIELDSREIRHLKTIETKNPDSEQLSLLRQRCYTAPFSGLINPADGLEGPHWIGYEGRGRVAKAEYAIFRELFKKGLIS